MNMPAIVAEFSKVMLDKCPYEVPNNFTKVLQKLYDELYINEHRVDLNNFLNDFIIRNCASWSQNFDIVGGDTIGDEVINNLIRDNKYEL